MVMGRRWTNKTDDWLIEIYGGKWWWVGLKCMDVMKTTKRVNMWNMMLCSGLRGQESLCGFSVASCSPTSLSKSTLCRRESSEPNEQTFFMTSRCSHQLHFLLAFFVLYKLVHALVSAYYSVSPLMIHIPFKQKGRWPPRSSLLYSFSHSYFDLQSQTSFLLINLWLQTGAFFIS